VVSNKEKQVLSFNESPSAEEVCCALSFVSPSCDRDFWARMAMAVKSELGSDGFSLWDDWSQAGDTYDKSAARATWRSIKSSGAGKSVTIGTLFLEAMKFGWKPEQTQINDEEKQRRKLVSAERKLKRQKDEERELAEEARWRDVYRQFFNQTWLDLIENLGPSQYIADKQIGFEGLGFPRVQFVMVTDSHDFLVWAVVGQENISQFFSDPKYKDRERYAIRYIKRGMLLVPMRDIDGVIYSAQIIYESGVKSFPRHAPKSGLFFVIGQLQNSGYIACAEGYATGRSVYEASGWPCVVGFDVYNLSAVAFKMNELFPNAKLVICGDDDVDNPKNPGRRLATKLAHDLVCPVVFPNFRELIA